MQFLSRVDLVGLIASHGSLVDAAVCDHAVAEAVRVSGGLDLALNAAGVMVGGDPAQPLDLHGQQHLLPTPIQLATDDYWEAVLATNTTSMFRAMRAELFQFVQQTLGHRDNSRGLRRS